MNIAIDGTWEKLKETLKELGPFDEVCLKSISFSSISTVPLAPEYTDVKISVGFLGYKKPC